MSPMEWLSLALVVSVFLLYHRVSLHVWLLSVGLLLVLATGFAGALSLKLITCWSLFIAVVVLFAIRPLRRRIFTRDYFQNVSTLNAEYVEY